MDQPSNSQRNTQHKSVMLTNIDFFDSFKKLKLNQKIDQAFEGRALE